TAQMTNSLMNRHAFRSTLFGELTCGRSGVSYMLRSGLRQSGSDLFFFKLGSPLRFVPSYFHSCMRPLERAAPLFTSFSAFQRLFRDGWTRWTQWTRWTGYILALKTPPGAAGPPGYHYYAPDGIPTELPGSRLPP